jgi:hypothetical protein
LLLLDALADLWAGRSHLATNPEKANDGLLNLAVKVVGSAAKAIPGEGVGVKFKDKFALFNIPADDVKPRLLFLSGAE